LIKISEGKAEKWVADVFGVDKRTVKSSPQFSLGISEKTIAGDFLQTANPSVGPA